MSEEHSSAEKTEQPTPRRLEEARQRGQVAKSTEIVITVSAAAIFATVLFGFPYVELWLENLFATIFLHISKETDMTPSCVQLATKILCVTVGFVAAISFVAVTIGNVSQFGFSLSFFPLNPDISKLSPMQGLKRILSTRTFFDFVKSVIKILVLGTATIFGGWTFIGQLVLLPFIGFSGLTQAIFQILIFFCSVIWVVWVLLSIADCLVQKHLHTKKLMMTVHEIRREHKEAEGDPEIRNTRKSIHREMLTEDTATATKYSTVLITNPLHYAVAIYYARKETPLPIVRAKGVGPIAALMRKIAREAGIPIIENVLIARALYDNAKISDAIPYDLLAPVAEILRWVSMLPKRQPQEE